MANLDDSVPDIKRSSSVAVVDRNEQVLFVVDVLDAERLKGYAGFEATMDRYRLPVSEYAKFIEQKNSTNNLLVPASRISIDKREAYEFWVTKQFNDGDSVRTLERDEAMFFVKPHDTILFIQFPLGSPSSSDIFATLRFP